MIHKLLWGLSQAAQVVLDSLRFLQRRDGPHLSLVNGRDRVDVAAILMGNSSKTGTSETGVSFGKTGSAEEL